MNSKAKWPVPGTALLLALVGAVVITGCGASGRGGPGRGDHAYLPAIEAAGFRTVVDNPYFPLVPGTTFRFIEKAGRETLENEVGVTSDTRVIMGVTCVVVHDTVKEAGTIKEDTFDWFAQDQEGNVWYFGETTKEFREDGKYSTEGSWEAGVDGAQPGIIMKARPSVGEAYRQEYLADQAEDMGQVAALDESVTVPFGNFTGCLRTKEWSLLEAGSEKKWYAKGVGCVRSQSTTNEVSELVAVTRP